MKRRLRAPSPALVIALIALFVALGGTTYAATSLPKNSVGTSQLKKGAVTKAKINKKTLTQLKGNRGPAGAAGAAGAQGIQGVQGVPGPDFERLAAQRDSTSGGVTADFSTAPTINTVTFTAPSAGFITVTGQAFVNNESIAGNYELFPRLDGGNISSSGFATAHSSPASPDLFTMNFSISTAVTAGAHTVTDVIFGPAGSSFYNQNNLNVLFVPTGTVVAAASHSGSSTNSLGH